MKKIVLSILLAIPTYSIAGGGGCDGCAPFPPKDILAECIIQYIEKVKSDDLPTGEHRSFLLAHKLLDKFSSGSQFYLQGGYNFQNIFSIYYSSFDAKKKYPDFNDYRAPVSVIVEPFEFSEITLYHQHTWSRRINSFPLIGDTLLYIKKNANSDVSFSLVWTHEKSFTMRKKILVASGEMICELTE